MFDLSARVFYRAHFDIEPVNSDVILFDVLINSIMTWLQNKHRSKLKHWNWMRFTQFGEFKSDDRSVSAFTTSNTIDAEKNWACRIKETQRNADYAPRSWTTEIGYQQKDASYATITYIVYYSDAPGFIGEQEPIPSGNIPSVVSRLLTNRNIACKIGNTVLSRHPRRAKTKSGPGFAQLLKDPDRGAPVVLVVTYGPDSDGEITYPLSADELMNNLAGNALVYYADDLAFCEELSYSVDLKYRVYPGYVRVYQPRLNMNDPTDCGRHRYMTPGNIETSGKDATIRMLRRAITQDIGYYETKSFFRYNDCQALYKANRMRELKAKLHEATEKMLSYEEYKELYEITEEQREQLSVENDHLFKSVSDLNDEKRKLEYENSVFKTQHSEAWMMVSDLNAALDGLRNQSEMPKNAVEIADYFEAVFAECITFTENGKKTLFNCVTKPSLIWNCLFHMATTLRQLFIAQTANIEVEFKQQSSWEMSLREGSQTRSDPRLMALRKDRYQGREISIEPHIKRGNRDDSPDSIRVYFCYDPETEKIIIGSCGNHIENYTSRTVH